MHLWNLGRQRVLHALYAFGFFGLCSSLWSFSFFLDSNLIQTSLLGYLPCHYVPSSSAQRIGQPHCLGLELNPSFLKARIQNRFRFQILAVPIFESSQRKVRNGSNMGGLKSYPRTIRFDPGFSLGFEAGDAEMRWCVIFFAGLAVPKFGRLQALSFTVDPQRWRRDRKLRKNMMETTKPPALRAWMAGESRIVSL